SSRRRHTRFSRDWSSDVCSSDLRSCFRARSPSSDDPTRTCPRCARVKTWAAHGRRTPPARLPPPRHALGQPGDAGLHAERGRARRTHHQNSVTLENGHLRVRTPEPTGDTELDETLQRLATHPGPPPAFGDWWISMYTPERRSRLLARLVQRGVMT